VLCASSGHCAQFKAFGQINFKPVLSLQIDRSRGRRKHGAPSRLVQVLACEDTPSTSRPSKCVFIQHNGEERSVSDAAADSPFVSVAAAVSVLH
jgi:hypothetical protein